MINLFSACETMQPQTPPDPTPNFFQVTWQVPRHYWWMSSRTHCNSESEKLVLNHRTTIGTLLRHLCHFCAIFMVNMWKRIPQRLRGVILLHFGLVTFRFHYGRTPKPLMIMIFGFLDVSMTPKTNMIYLWRHQKISNNVRQILNP